MPTPIELNLLSLIPTLSYLPDELTALASSLLAQSRNKAASLKPEEEIGRTYACCHIACQRLGHKLALEIAKPAPPVKPRVYTKLHAYLNTVLKTTATPRKGTPNAKRSENKLEKEDAPRATRKAVGSATATPATTPTSRKRKREEVDEVVTEAPKYAMPLIRHLCTQYDTPAAVAHVFAGFSSVLKHPLGINLEKKIKLPESKAMRERINRIDPADVPTAILTLFAAVINKMYGTETMEGKTLLGQSEIYTWRREAVNKCREFFEANTAELDFLVHELEDLSADPDWSNDLFYPYWTTMEWWSNVPSVEDQVAETAEVDGDEVAEDMAMADTASSTPVKAPSKTPLRRKEKHASAPGGYDELGPAGLLPGLGTMFQPAVDWLSDERRAEYARWKKGILREAAMVEVKG
ncbi:hypothetical protein LTR37_007109 [Vermiconidia calcicola]|uniref:Uncharacterized protein n=1 Tax=Vermiconidia calcicola TaxID=1690605 RepID=A0ACC3NE70_9PEZI|nr:hypothetical protein LTR37_007109 [Vermiconidia calcicola]